MKPAGQMTITLTDELEQFVRSEVSEGAFASNSEYIRELVRERYRKKVERDEKLKALDAALTRGMNEADAGRVMPLKDAFRHIRDTLGLQPDESSAL